MGKKEEERRVTPGWAHVGSIAAMRATKTFPAKNSATERVPPRRDPGFLYLSGVLRAGRGEL